MTISSAVTFAMLATNVSTTKCTKIEVTNIKVGDIKNVESEAGVIASIIMKPELSYYSEQLKSNHFTDSSNAYIYYAVCELAKQGIEKIDAYNITNILNAKEATKKQTDIITIQALNDLIDVAKVIARDTVEEYMLLVKNVLDAAFRRETYNKLVDCERLCFNCNENDIREKIYGTLDKVMMDYSSTNDMPEYKDIVDELWEKIQAKQNGESSYIEFPFPELNKYVVIEPSELICFTSCAKGGKSAMLLTVTVDLLKKNKSVLYIDSEISTELFTLRIVSHLTKIKFSRLRSGDYTEEEKQSISKALAWLKTRKFIHIYMPVFSADAIYLAAKKAKHTIGIECIVVDYLKSTSNSSEAFSVYAEMGQLSDTLKNRIVGEMKLCGITAAQATSTGKIADSARIARSVSTVISITDKSLEEMDKDGVDGGNKKLRVVFNRNGEQMSENEWIDMKFDGSVINYTQAKQQHESPEPF